MAPPGGDVLGGGELAAEEKPRCCDIRRSWAAYHILDAGTRRMPGSRRLRSTVVLVTGLSGLTADHWVSRGLQSNFASEQKRVAIINVREARIVDNGRPIKSNFREVGFTTFLEAGVPNDLLERAFASVERTVLNQIRQVDISNRSPAEKAAVANLFAIHLVRSPSFKRFHIEVMANFGASDVPRIARDRRLSSRFEREFDRPPTEGELVELVHRQYESMMSDPMTLVQSMVRQHDQMAEKLNRFHMQVVEFARDVPGLVLGDTPVVHADTRNDRYGFRDRLALGDANLIIGPLTRRVAACLTARPFCPVRVTTRRLADDINSIFLRAADREVACHPDDARKLRQTASRLDRHRPPVGTFGGS